MFALLAETVLTTMNFLWVASAGLAAWFLVSAMSRRQARLTEVLRNHVDRTQKANEAAATSQDSPPAAEQD